MLVRYGIDRLIPPSLRPAPQEEPIDNPVVRREIARAQRIVEGQSFEIRKTLWRYTDPIEEQRRLVHQRRQDLLLGRRPPQLWNQQQEARRRLVDAVGEAEVLRAEIATTLFHIDRAWSDHLSFVTDLREGNHLVGLGGKDPLTHFKLETATAFHHMQAETDDAIGEALAQVAIGSDGLDLSSLGLEGPSSTWTYLINDDPFRDQLSMMLTGPGKTSMGIGAALYAPVLLVLWAVVDRFFRQRPPARPEQPRRNGATPPD